MSREGVFEKMGTGFSSWEKALGVTKVLRSRLCTRLLSCPSIPHTLFKPDFCIENILKTFLFSDVNIHSQILLLVWTFDCLWKLGPMPSHTQSRWIRDCV